MLKRKMKDREFQSQQAILSAVAKMWNDFTFADVQRAFQEWMECLPGSLETMVIIIQTKAISLGNGFLSNEIGRAVKTFWTRYIVTLLIIFSWDYLDSQQGEEFLSQLFS
jgi:hypothetical protein